MTRKKGNQRGGVISEAGAEVQTQGFGATLFRFRDNRGCDMHKHYSNVDMLTVKVAWLRDNLRPADKRAGKGRNHYVCPLCGSPDVFNPIWSRGQFHCYKCDRGGSVFDVVASQEGVSFGDAVRLVMESRGAEGQEYKPRPRVTTTMSADVIGADNRRDVLQWRLICRGYCIESAARFIGSPGQEYIDGRGFTLDTCQRFGLGFDAEAFKEGRGTGGTLAAGVPAVILPYGPRRDYYGGRLLRALGSTRYMKPGADVAGAEPVYNAGGLWGCDLCFIVEGWADVLTVYQAGKLDGLTVGAVALNGTGHRALIDTLKRKPTRARLVIALDDDAAGHRGAVRVGRELEGIGAAAGIWAGGYAFDGCKDFGDVLKREPRTAAAVISEIARDAAQGALFSAAEAAEGWAEGL